MWIEETIGNKRKFIWGRMRPAFTISIYSIQRCTVLREEKVSSSVKRSVSPAVHCLHTHTTRLWSRQAFADLLANSFILQVWFQPRRLRNLAWVWDLSFSGCGLTWFLITDIHVIPMYSDDLSRNILGVLTNCLATAQTSHRKTVCDIFEQFWCF